MNTDLPSPARAADVDLGKVRRWLTEHTDDLLADLAAYVSLETPSDSKPHLDEALRWLTDQVTATLGPPESSTRHDGGALGDTLVADFPGLGPRRLLLLCHYDTVWSAGTLADWPYARSGPTATGPGIFDMKAGLVQGLWAIRALDAVGLPRPPLRIVLNGDEELGSIFSRPTVEASADGVDAALVLEPGVHGAVKTARKGVGIFRIEVDGVEAHAGLDPERGVSAIDEMARVVLRLRALEDLDRGTSVNIGTVTGGSRTNVIAGRARAMLDVRVTTPEEATRIETAVAALRPTHEKLAVRISGGWNRPPMPRTPGIAAMYDLARALAAGHGEDLDECAAGGGSDANFLAALGLPVLDGIGAVGDGAHARGEHILVEPTIARTALVAGLICLFAQ
ncbi:M20 family metallopeptidase [Micromonospora sp. WMMD1128]|uniref:M20 family metallopeptidase n=1 Tax=unclassified Micromonospora TaxID=2617518 RepID=UPI00248CB5A6|nr:MULTISPECIES: M20 family metallopeptidase [unclassified Micromonospora]WBB71329.1 M20 family metallopeptidase [Micromonospora sp. WMMD1128]WFE35202.1 M20 family metallopeptidase [Micromonospora sp. WMMD975]